MGLTNELLYLNHREIVEKCRLEAEKLSSSVTPEERRFMAEMKSRSIILPFSIKASKQKHLEQGDMVTLVDLAGIVEYIRNLGLSHCIGCQEFNPVMSRTETGELVVEVQTHDPQECGSCYFETLDSGFPDTRCYTPNSPRKLPGKLSQNLKLLY